MDGRIKKKELEKELEKKFKKDEVSWYVLRVTYQREMAAAKQFEKLGVEHFVPTVRKKIHNNQGLAIGWRTEPLIHNYIFVHDRYSNIYKIKHGKMDFLRFMMSKNFETGLKEPQRVPDKQMSDFMKVVRTRGSKPVDVDIDLRKGDRVRVLTGLFEGVEGVYVRMPNRHEKRVVVKIEGVSAYATAELKASDVEKLEGKETETTSRFNGKDA